MPKEIKPVKIVFAPGCFDSFEGTQEELDAMIAEITDMIESGNLLEHSQPFDLDFDPEELEEMIEQDLNNPDGFLASLAEISTRKLQ